jgi:hypothetical protein
LQIRAHSVAIGADNVAFRDFGEDPLL